MYIDSHPNIIAYKEAFIDEASATLCLVMEYADNGDLLAKINEHHSKITYFKETDIWAYLTQILLGLKSLHDYKICHRDIKSANIFLSGQQIKLGDLNVSKIAKKGMLHTQTSTPYYASPEVWRDRPYDSKSDLWSVGCVLYELIMLRPPFKSTDIRELFRKVISGDYPPIVSTRYSADLIGIVKQILQQNPIVRPSCLQLLTQTVFQRNINDPILLSQLKSLSSYAFADDLLNTIKLPKVLRQLQFPKPNYKRQMSQPARMAERNIIGGMGTP